MVRANSCNAPDPSKSKEPDRGILCSVKSATTPDVTSGIKSAIANALEQAKIDRDAVIAVMIGTTVFHPKRTKAPLY